ncbi:MBL fold metallo-hydrolase [Aliikangiella maris]|uniref:MBL fold metallo-hydrolase n=2 Tax=Aliikangiella maris TaxID=3162458 RepID=A0ABV2BU10_9GAMM
MNFNQANLPFVINPDVNAQVVVIRVCYQWMINYNYLIIDPQTRAAVIVDPAWEFDKLNATIAQHQVTLRGVLLTHSHADHIHLADRIAKTYACPVWMSQIEIEHSQFDCHNLQALELPLTHNNGEALSVENLGSENLNSEKLNSNASAPTLLNPFTIEGLTIYPVLTPGHTPGCICYWINGHLFTGDVLFAEGCGLCRNEAAAFQMYDSLAYLKQQLTPQTRIFPGHSYGREPGQLFANVLRENMYLQFKTKASFSAFRLRKNQSKARLFGFS